MVGVGAWWKILPGRVVVAACWTWRVCWVHCWVGWGGGKEGMLGGTLRLEMDRMLAWVVTFEQTGQYVLHGVSCIQKRG